MRGSAALARLGALLILSAFGWVAWQSRGTHPISDELVNLRHANMLLQRRVAAYEQQRLQETALTPSGASSSNSSSRFTSTHHFDVHRHWDWRSIVDDFLRPWPGISRAQLDSAVQACNGSAMYCQRFQVVDGKLYITDYAAIFFDRHYAPARVLPLLDTLRRHPSLPNLDVVVAANDEPRIHLVPGDPSVWERHTCTRHCGGDGRERRERRGGREPQARPPPALFSATTNRASLDLPWLDFAWFFPRRPHKLRTPPWSVLHPQLVAAGGAVAWGTKIELAMHTGNVGSGTRKRLAQVARANPGTMLVNELFIGDHVKVRKTCRELGIDRRGGFQQHRCYMTFAEQCGYKYLLNSASIGYANKFKSLLLCGSVVIYVREGMRHKEFYEYGLLPGVHYVTVDSSEEIPEMVRWLRANDGYAQAVAQAGRARMEALGAAALSDFMRELLSQYSKRLKFKVTVQPGAVRIDCEDDLWRHYALDRVWLARYLTQDNSSCVHSPLNGAAPLGPPGWGGAYRGSKPRCYASHDRSPAAQPHACDFESPFSTSESFEPDGVWPRAHPRNKDGWGVQ
jgi:hypothetical protein